MINGDEISCKFMFIHNKGFFLFDNFTETTELLVTNPQHSIVNKALDRDWTNQ